MNTRHERFIEAKVEGASHTDAAKAAGYSPRTAGQQGHTLFKNPEIRAEIDRRLSAAMRESGASPVEAYAALKRAYEDEARSVRAPAVRAAEIVLKASGELGPESVTQVNLHTPLIVGAESLTIEELEALAVRVGAGEALPAGLLPEAD
ncbi:MAG: terminase small subunit [Dehalococcoidia bacterium]